MADWWYDEVRGHYGPYPLGKAHDADLTDVRWDIPGIICPECGCEECCVLRGKYNMHLDQLEEVVAGKVWVEPWYCSECHACWDYDYWREIGIE